MEMEEFTDRVVLPSSAIMFIVFGVSMLLLKNRVADAGRDIYDHAPGWYGWPLSRRMFSSARGVLISGLLSIGFGLYLCYKAIL